LSFYPLRLPSRWFFSIAVDEIWETPAHILEKKLLLNEADTLDVGTELSLHAAEDRLAALLSFHVLCPMSFILC